MLQSGTVEKATYDLLVSLMREPFLQSTRLMGGDISAMKMHAITNSGNRPKDFVDIAYLSQYYSYNQIKSMALEKYPMYDPIMFDRAVIYFGDVNTDAIDQIKMLHSKMNWSKIERRIIDMTNYPDKVFTKSPI